MPLNFTQIQQAIHKQTEYLYATYPNSLFRVAVDSELLYETYLESFNPLDNPIYRERTEHDCQCCKKFIRDIGNMVAITEDNKLISIWDVEVPGGYQQVVDAMSSLVKNHNIRTPYLHKEKQIGLKHNHELDPSTQVLVKYNHFNTFLPNHLVSKDMLTSLSANLADYTTLKGSLQKITLSAIETVIDLIENNSIYKGQEYLQSVKKFHKTYTEYLVHKDSSNIDLFVWRKSLELGKYSRFKNSVIGTLVLDISKGKELEYAVKSYETKVAPDNYKRSSKVVTANMLQKAKDNVEVLGLLPALSRRYATKEDVSISNVIYADHFFVKPTNVFDELIKKTQSKIPLSAKEVSIDTFIQDIVPQSDCIELFIENRLQHNMMSLVAPMDATAPSLFKWDNGFSWAYNGDVTDSLKDRVAAAGGKVDGVLRFSIQWNDCGDNNVDFDAHCTEPNNNHIYYPSKGDIHPSSGILDVDIMNPNGKVAVENITYSNLSCMPKGNYIFDVHNFTSISSKAGFTAEIEYDNNIYKFSYDKSLRGKETIQVATVNLGIDNKITTVKSLKSAQKSNSIWNINTQTYHKVSLILNSPNHWDSKKQGNKHLFFILDDCINPENSRGFYSEFLREDLHDNRKAFELLGSEMKTQKSDNQLSGLGFSSTQQNHVYCKVSGKINQIFKINF